MPTENEKKTAPGRLPALREPLDEKLVDPASAVSFLNIDEAKILEYLFNPDFSTTKPA